MSIKFDIRSAAAALLSTRSAEKQAAMEKQQEASQKLQQSFWLYGGLIPGVAAKDESIFIQFFHGASCELPSFVEMPRLERQLKDKILGMEGKKIWEKAQADLQLEETLAANNAIINHSQEAVDGIKVLKAEALKAKAFAEQVDRHLLNTANQVNVSNSVTEAIKESLLTEYADKLEELNNLLADW